MVPTDFTDYSDDLLSRRLRMISQMLSLVILIVNKLNEFPQNPPRLVMVPTDFTDYSDDLLSRRLRMISQMLSLVILIVNKLNELHEWLFCLELSFFCWKLSFLTMAVVGEVVARLATIVVGGVIPAGEPFHGSPAGLSKWPPLRASRRLMLFTSTD